MADTLAHLMARAAGDDSLGSPLIEDLLIALVVLIAIALVSTLALLFIRRQKNKAAARRESLPQYKELTPPSSSSSRSQHRRHSDRPGADYVWQEKQRLMEESDAPRSPSPVPEIRVTLPEEVDAEGKAQDGRVVVVHVGESTIGFEPYTKQLPSYQQSESDRFQSLDLERIGGLKEKDDY